MVDKTVLAKKLSAIDPTTTAGARARQETVYDSGDRTFIIPIGSLS